MAKKSKKDEPAIEKLTELPLGIRITVDEKSKNVKTVDYVWAKTLSLKQFGYANLSEDTVREQLLKVLNGEELNVIGMFMEKEVSRLA